MKPTSEKKSSHLHQVKIPSLWKKWQVPERVVKSSTKWMHDLGFLV